jgi:hypothetical protein
MKFNDADLQSLLLDLFAMHGTDAEVSRQSGVSRVTLWRMENWSMEGKEGLQEVNWGGVIKPWHMHKLDALDMHVTDVQQELTFSSSRGRKIPMVAAGAYCFEDCEYAASLTAKQLKEHLEMDDEMRELLSVPRVWEDRKKRVLNPKTGFYERVRAVQDIAPSLEAQAKVLSALAPDVFGDRRRIDLNVQGGLGVTVIGQPIQPPRHLVDITPAVEAITDQTDAEDAEVIDYNEPPEAIMPEQPFTPDPASPLTEEQQRILARSRSASPLTAELAARASAKLAEVPAPAVQKPIQPPPPSSNRFDDMADDVVRVPRGMKVV